MAELSIILLTWNSELYFLNCINSVLESTSGFDCEIIIVDNGSTDSTVDMIRSYVQSDHIIFISNDKNEGVAKARNIGISLAKGNLIWLLDIDTVVNKEAISAMMTFMATNENCGLCACKLMNSFGEIQDSCRKYPSFRFKFYNVLSAVFRKFSFTKQFKKKIDKLNDSQFYREQMAGIKPFSVEYVIGACQLIRKEVIEQVGLLDENIFYGPEDADFCFRVHQKGWDIFYLPAVSFIHEYQQMTNKRLFSRMSIVHTKALFYYFWKHR